MADQMEPPKEDFSVGPLSVLSESVKKNCQVAPVGGAARRGAGSRARARARSAGAWRRAGARARVGWRPPVCA